MMHCHDCGETWSGFAPTGRCPACRSPFVGLTPNPLLAQPTPEATPTVPPVVSTGNAAPKPTASL